MIIYCDYQVYCLSFCRYHEMVEEKQTLQNNLISLFYHHISMYTMIVHLSTCYYDQLDNTLSLRIYATCLYIYIYVQLTLSPLCAFGKTRMNGVSSQAIC